MGGRWEVAMTILPKPPPPNVKPPSRHKMSRNDKWEIKGVKGFNPRISN